MRNRILYRLIQWVVPLVAWFIPRERRRARDCHNCANLLPRALAADAMNDNCSATNTSMDNARQVETLCGSRRRFWQAKEARP